MKKIALFDLDGSLANYDKCMSKHLSEIFGFTITADEIRASEDYSKYRKLKQSDPDFWKNLEVLDQGLKSLNLARELGYEIHIATKCPRNEFAAQGKMHWILDKFGTGKDIQYHLTSDKTIIKADILYDDYPVYIEGWLNNNPNGVAVMPDRSYNKDYKHDRCIRQTELNIGHTIQTAAIRGQILNSN